MASSAQYASFDLPTEISVDLVESGIPIDAIPSFAASSGLKLADIYEVVIPARTLKHRRSRGETLSRDESDKLARLMRLYRQALSVFADRAKAVWWLHEPQVPFENRTPLQMVRTEVGGRLLEEKLIQIDEGMFA